MHRKNEGADSEYRMNKKTGKLYVISGPSGAGKGTLRELALNNIENLVYSISCTTRHPRENDVDGKTYRFITHDDFNSRIKQNLFLEYAHVHDNLYGTLKKDVMNELESGKNVLLEIDVQGALQVKKQMPEAVLIFIDVPSIDELEKRFISTKEAYKSIQGRLKTLENVLQTLETYLPS